MNKACKISTESFSKLALCHSLYKFHDCFNEVGGKGIPRTCSNVCFPNHPCASQRKPCNAKLIAEVKLGFESNKSCFYPLKVYCYNSLMNSLKKLMERDGDLQTCEEWRNEQLKKILEDLYDGNVWKSFMHYNS